MKVKNQTHAVVAIDFRDWKWLSHIHRFQTTVSDPEVLKGDKPGHIEVNFKDLSDSDKAGKSRFEVADRLFYETHVFGFLITSFTNSGFFERL